MQNTTLKGAILRSPTTNSRTMIKPSVISGILK